MQRTLLSIIIPCYNSAETVISYLNKVSYSNSNEIQFVIIDDCSTNDSYKQLLEYKDSSELDIKVIKNEYNRGPGQSRNICIQKSTGEYLMFLDADDELQETFFDRIMPILAQKTMDCIIFDMQIIKGNNKTSMSMFFNGNSEEYPSKNETIVFVRGSTCGKIYKSKIIKDNGIAFLDQKRNEDMPFTKLAISHCEKIMHIAEPLYLYIQGENSLMHNKRLTNKVNAQNAFNEVANKMDATYSAELEALFLFEYVYSTGLTALGEYGIKEWKKYIDDTKKVFRINLENKYFKQYSLRIRIITKLIVKKQYCIVKLICFLQNMVKKLRY